MRSGTPALKVMTWIKGRPVTRFEPGLTLVRLEPESIGVAGRWHLRGMCVSRRRPPRHRQHAGAVRESPACRGYTSKHGLIGLTRTLAAEWGRARCSCECRKSHNKPRQDCNVRHPTVPHGDRVRNRNLQQSDKQACQSCRRDRTQLLSELYIQSRRPPPRRTNC